MIPDEKTKNNIKAKGLLQSDKQRADDYKRVKHIIDEYHKAYIEERLADFALKYDNDGGK